MSNFCECCGKKLGLLSGRFAIDDVNGELCTSCYDALLPYYNDIYKSSESDYETACCELREFAQKNYDSKGVAFVERVIYEHKNGNKEDDINQGPICQFSAIHIYGLPLAEELQCDITTYDNRVEFHSGTTHITLDRKKITDMCTRSETEIQQQYVSSAGGAIAGAVLFGVLGAMIGGRAKKKTTKSTTIYLIITYKKADDSIANICFDVSDHSFLAKTMAQLFRMDNSQGGGTYIEL